MDTREEMQRLEERQLELLSIMRRSDDHAAKCAKLGRSFEHDYPQDYADYTAANAEYNANESRLAELALLVESEYVEGMRNVEPFNIEDNGEN